MDGYSPRFRFQTMWLANVDVDTKLCRLRRIDPLMSTLGYINQLFTFLASYFTLKIGTTVFFRCAVFETGQDRCAACGDHHLSGSSQGVGTLLRTPPAGEQTDVHPAIGLWHRGQGRFDVGKKWFLDVLRLQKYKLKSQNIPNTDPKRA